MIKKSQISNKSTKGKYQITKSRSNSYIAITVLILMLVLVAITYLFAQVIYGDLAIARNNKASTVAFSLAEAGIQEAIYKIQYDTTPGGAREQFLSGGTDVTFSHSSALIPNGSYTVTIHNTGDATIPAATITATGFDQMGSKRAQRVSTLKVYQDTERPNPIWDIGAAFFTSVGSIQPHNSTINIYNGGIFSASNIVHDQSTVVNVEKDIAAEGIVQGTPSFRPNCNCEFVDQDPLIPQCSSNPGCTFKTNQPPQATPTVSFDYYKNKAISAGTCYGGGVDCNKTLPRNANLTGIIYIDGPLNIIKDDNITINGLLATTGTITYGNKGKLTVNANGNNPAGIITGGSLDINNPTTTMNIQGLIRVGGLVNIQHTTLNLTGGIIAGSIDTQNATINIHYDPNIIDQTLTTAPTVPVFRLDHWEESYY